MFGLLASVGVTISSGLGVVYTLLTFSPIELVAAVFVFLFGVLGMILEMKPSSVPSIYLHLLYDEAHFLFRPLGRSLYYIFVGTFLLTQYGLLYYICGICCCGVGILVYTSCQSVITMLNILHNTDIYTEAMVLAKFHQFDMNGDHKLDVKELTALCTSVDPSGHVLSPNEVESAMLIITADVTMDGMVSECDFMEWWKRHDTSF